MFKLQTDDDQAPYGFAATLLGSDAAQVPIGLAATLTQQTSGQGIAPARPGLGAGLGGGDFNDGAGTDVPAAGGAKASPTEGPAAGEWSKLLAQLYEAGKFRSGYLSKIFGAVDYANLSAEAANDTIIVGLRNIDWYENDPFHDHQSQQLGSLINWRLVDWSKYGADQNLPPVTVMRNFLTAAMN